MFEVRQDQVGVRCIIKRYRGPQCARLALIDVVGLDCLDANYKLAWCMPLVLETAAEEVWKLSLRVV